MITYVTGEINLVSIGRSNFKMSSEYIYINRDGTLGRFNRFSPFKIEYIEEVNTDEDILNVAGYFYTDRDVCLLIDNDASYILKVYRGSSGLPVYECIVGKCPYNIDEDSLELTNVFNDETGKFLSLATFAFSSSDSILGSSMYLRWDGEKYVYEIGELDNWTAGEDDDEYEIVNGELQRKIFI